jgi:pSer/pThr/pTyr-binding forkhead associated (FHA) protein
MTDASPAYLVVRRGPASQQTYLLSDQTLILGREAINDIALNDPEISRRHASITYRDGRYVIEDLGSTNGTFVNGRRITAPTMLSNGDVLELAQAASFLFRGPGETDKETMVQPAPQPVEPATMLDSSDFEDDDAYRGEVLTTEAQSPVPPGAEPQPKVVVSPGPPPDIPRSRQNTTRLLIGCGCLLLLLIVACGAAVFLLDAWAPDVLYCGPLQPIIELTGLNLACP